MRSALPQDQLDKLLAIMTFDGAADNEQLKDRYNFSLTGRKRIELEQEGYISCKRESGRAPFHHELTDKGRAYCRSSMRADIDPKAKLRDRIHQGMFKHLDALLTGHRPDQVKRAPLKKATTASVQAAYSTLAPKPGAWVSLKRLRSELPDVERNSLDHLITDLHLAGALTLIPEENRRSITPEDRDAAIRIGDEERHLVAMGGSDGP